MSLDKLTPSKGSLSNKKRIGRGNGSGWGRTAGKGHNGYKSRSGASGKLHFEGGQMPLMRRLPKRGMKIFSKNHRKKLKYQIINIETIASYKVKKIDFSFLIKKGLISKNTLVKILSKGEINKPVEVYAHKFSVNAISKIEKSGGKVNFI